MKPEVLYSDADLIAINKPPGLPVHGGVSVSGPTLADFLLSRFPDIRGVGDMPDLRPGIVHRLDKDTSGVMVVARTRASFTELKRLFQERRVEKIYRAIVCGLLKNRRGTIALPMGRLVRNPLKRGTASGSRRIRGAREAVTDYRVLRQGEKHALLEIHPHTGRMHQIRVHLKALGHPVACDRVYGGKNVCCPEGAARQLLHAHSLSFSMPGGRRFRFEADPPDDFRIAEERFL